MKIQHQNEKCNLEIYFYIERCKCKFEDMDPGERVYFLDGGPIVYHIYQMPILYRQWTREITIAASY